MKILDNFYRFGMDSSSFNGLICVVVMPDDSKNWKKAWICEENHEKCQKIHDMAQLFYGDVGPQSNCATYVSVFSGCDFAFLRFCSALRWCRVEFFLRLRFRVFYDFWRFWPIPFFAPRAVTISSFEPLKRARIELFNGPKLVINCADGIEKRRERFRKIRFWAENMEFFENLKIFVFLEFRLVEKLIRSGQDLERSFTPFCNVFHQ